MFIIHSCIFHGEVSNEILHPFLNWVDFLLLTCTFKIYSGYECLIRYVSMLTHSVRCLFTFLMVSFKAQIFLILMKSNLSIFSFSHFFPFGVMFRRLSGITSFNLLILGARHRAWHIASTQYLRTGTTYFSLSKLGNSLITASFT